MNKGDLVRVWSFDTIEANRDSWGFNAVAIVLEYHSWEKIATVVMQATGESRRIAARELEILQRSPENVRMLCELYREKNSKKD